MYRGAVLQLVRLLHTYIVLLISARNLGIAHSAYHVSKGVSVLSS